MQPESINILLNKVLLTKKKGGKNTDLYILFIFIDIILVRFLYKIGKKSKMNDKN